MKIKISKSQWESMGKQAGWMKTALVGSRDAIIDFDSFEFIEPLDYDALKNSNAWLVTYNDGTLNDQDLLTSLRSLYGNGLKYYVQLFAAGNFSASNVRSGQKMTAEELAKIVFPNAEAFWDAIRQSNEMYDEEKAIEQRDMGMFDDQALGHSDKYGPDRQTPQY